MCRSLDLTLEPAAAQRQGWDTAPDVTLHVYTYTRDLSVSRELTERVYLSLATRVGSLSTQLAPDEARELAKQLTQAADQASEQRALNEARDDIEQSLRDPDFDASLVRFCHPDVVYAPEGKLGATVKAHPGKLVIELARDGKVAA